MYTITRHKLYHCYLIPSASENLPNLGNNSKVTHHHILYSPSSKYIQVLNKDGTLD